MMLPFRLIEDLSIESKDEVERIIAEMRRAVANDDNNSGDSATVDPNKDGPTLSR